MFRPLIYKQAAFLLLTSLSAVLVSGCANFAGTAAPSVDAAAVSLSGTLYGGSQVIGSASMKLMAAGNTGYGTGPVQLGSTITSDPTTGAWTFSGVACPTGNASTSLVYVTAQGGVTGGQANNPNILLMVALGPCQAIKTATGSGTTKVAINEDTTIAAMAALHSFSTLASSGVTIGAPASNVTGLTNAFATANNLVPYSVGQGAITNATGMVTGFATNPSITITPETAKSNLEANILAACVEAVANCTTLFMDVSSTAALDTLQAAYAMQTNITSTVNGTSNIAALFALSTANSPFQAAQATQPTDWTLGITYGSNSTSTAGNYFLTSPEYVAIDATGNLWVANYVSPSTGTTAGSVVELSPSGTPLTQVLVGSIAGPAAITLDPSGNVWVPNFGVSAALQSTVVEYKPSTAATSTYTVSPGPQGLASDGAGNMFVISPSYKGAGALTEIPAGTASGATLTALATGLTTDFSNVAIDSNDTVWITGGGTGALGGTAGYAAVYQFLYSSSAPTYPSTPSATTTAGSITEPEAAIAVDGGNNVWVGNYAKSTLSEFSGTTTITGNANSPITATGLTKAQYAVFDGAGNVWMTNAVSGAGAVFGYTSAGVAISPTVGLAHTYKESYGIAVDPSGNIWVGNQATSSLGALGFVTEIVGGAVPVLTPVSAGLPVTAGGTNKLASKP